MNQQKHTTKPYVIDADEDMTLTEWLSCYGYLLDPRRDPNCYLWLGGRLSREDLYFAASVIYRRYGMEFTPPAPKLVEREPRPAAKPARRQRRQQATAKAA